MDKNIEAYIKDNNHYIFPSDLVWRIIGIFIYTIILIYFTVMLFPSYLGFENVLFSKLLPFEIGLIITVVLLAFIFVLLYVKKKVWSFFAIRAITCGYLALTGLIYSMLRPNGENICFESIPFIIVKLLFFIMIVVLYPIIFSKKILPKFSETLNCNSLNSLWLCPALICTFSRIIRSINMDANDGLAFLGLLVYSLSAMGIYLSIQLFTKSYYAKKYVTVDKFGIVAPTARKKN